MNLKWGAILEAILTCSSHPVGSNALTGYLAGQLRGRRVASRHPPMLFL